jgi:hypothetical protein
MLTCPSICWINPANHSPQEAAHSYKDVFTRPGGVEGGVDFHEITITVVKATGKNKAAKAKVLSLVFRSLEGLLPKVNQ